MAKTGLYAKVTMDVGGVPVDVMELREWSVSGSSEKISTDSTGNEWATHLIGRRSWEGEATCIGADEYYLDLIGTMTTISFFDHKDDTEAAYTGEASIDFERSTPHDDVIESTVTFTGNGELTSPKADVVPV